jgi:hypothetical protein
VPELLAVDNDAVDRASFCPVELGRQPGTDPFRTVDGGGRQPGKSRISARPQPRADGSSDRCDLLTSPHIDVAINHVVLAAQPTSSDVTVGQCFGADERPAGLPHVPTLARWSDAASRPWARLTRSVENRASIPHSAPGP